MVVTEIPLTADNQTFNITLNGNALTMRIVWRDALGWVMDLQDSSGSDLVAGIPMVTGTNLLAQYAYLGLGFGLSVACDEPGVEYPTQTGLGTTSHLYVITES
ncbi:hypothetical protein [Rahnella sp. CJA17(1/100)]|uniref:phage baseplate plug family protein n=1 Tax=Rahnella sp. CJA17(1/100) TaxID=2508951 RepID=UPI00106FD010|nr:hypothetical protein [Rahnella sp. CJA17(1/100)]